MFRRTKFLGGTIHLPLKACLISKIFFTPGQKSRISDFAIASASKLTMRSAAKWMQVEWEVGWIRCALSWGSEMSRSIDWLADELGVLPAELPNMLINGSSRFVALTGQAAWLELPPPENAKTVGSRRRGWSPVARVAYFVRVAEALHKAGRYVHTYAFLLEIASAIREAKDEGRVPFWGWKWLAIAARRIGRRP